MYYILREIYCLPRLFGLGYDNDNNTFILANVAVFVNAQVGL
jgi:hypothetical protein